MSVDSAGTRATTRARTGRSATSTDGRYVAFDSYASNLVVGDTNRRHGFFVRDTVPGRRPASSVDSLGTQSTPQPVRGDLGRRPLRGVRLLRVQPRGRRHERRRGRGDPRESGPGGDRVVAVDRDAGESSRVTLTGSGFVSGASVRVDGAGVSASHVRVVSPTRIRATLTVASGAATGRRTVWVAVPGTGPGPAAGAQGACFACLTVA